MGRLAPLYNDEPSKRFVMNALRSIRGLARVLPALLVGLAFVAIGPGEVSAADTVQSRASAPTRVSIADLASGKRDRLEFSDAAFSGWIRRDGEIYLEADVGHNGLFCAEYQAGVRFGVGAPGCSNVQWLSEAVYASRRMQCNNAGLRHVGGATEASLTAIFDRITCAERIIRCSGAGCR